MRSELKNTERVINEFGDVVVFETKKNLRSTKFGGPQKISGKLYRSVSYDLTSNQRGFVLDFLMEQYGEYHDRGVTGAGYKTTKKKNQKRKPVFRSLDSFKYTTKMPPPSKLDKFIVRRGLAPRLKGRFTVRKISTAGFKKSVQFAVAKSIFHRGFKPSLFFTTPYENNLKGFPRDLEKALAMDIENLF